MLKLKNNSTGFTLIELLISIAVGLVIVAGIITLFTLTTTSSQDTIKRIRLNQSLSTTMQTIVSDIRRAGYWAGATTGAVTNNPFMVVGSTDITVNGAQNCVLLTYDANSDGVLPSITSASDDERYGYRLTNGAIQFRPWGASFDCNASSVAWSDLTDPGVVTITAFTVVLSTESVVVEGGLTLKVRKAVVTLSGELTNDSSITSTLTEEVKIYNDGV